jgi:hypothetical protein
MSTRRNTTDRTLLARYVRRAMVGLTTVAVIALMAACADAPSSPAQPLIVAGPSLAKGGNGNGKSKPGQPTGTATTQAQDSVWPGEVLATPVTAEGLQRKQPLAAEVTASFLVTKAGGYYTLPGTGLSLWVPPFAIPGDTLTITMTAIAGDVVAYHFGPHGTQFSKSLVLTQDLTQTNYQSRAGATFDVGYFGAEADVNVAARTAPILEKLQNYFDGGAGRLFFAVNHFSGYMVAWGFHGDAF